MNGKEPPSTTEGIKASRELMTEAMSELIKPFRQLHKEVAFLLISKTEATPESLPGAGGSVYVDILSGDPGHPRLVSITKPPFFY